MHRILILILISLLSLGFLQRQGKKGEVRPLSKAQLQQQLAETNRELADLLRRFPEDEDEVQRATSHIKSEFRLRDLRWKSFERAEPISNDVFIVYPVQVELLATYERLTDALLNLAASNYVIVVDTLDVTRAQMQAPLVSVEARLVMLIYTLRPEARKRLQSPIQSDTAAQLVFIRRSIETVLPLYEARVGCWTTLRSLGRVFPKSLEALMTELHYSDTEVEMKAVSRLAPVAAQIETELKSSGLFRAVETFRNGAFFTLKAQLDTTRAYQQWLEGKDTLDVKGLARDPFRSPYSFEQLTYASGAGDSYPPLDKRIEEYLQQVNAGKTPSRIAPFLVAELTLAGLFYGQGKQWAIFRTPDQREIYVTVGAYCYNGRFSDLQQGRTIFEEEVMKDGQPYRNQVVKNIESSCTTSLQPQASPPDPSTEALLRARLPRSIVTLNYSQIDIYSLFPVLSEMGEGSFNYVLDSRIPHFCTSFNRDRTPFAEQIITLLKQNGLKAVEASGVFLILPSTVTLEQTPVFGYSVDSPPKGFGSTDYSAEAINLSVTEITLGEILDSLGSKYEVNFVAGERERAMRISATMNGVDWDDALSACLSSCGLAALIEADRTIITTPAELVRLQNQGKVRF